MVIDTMTIMNAIDSIVTLWQTGGSSRQLHQLLAQAKTEQSKLRAK